MTIPVSPTKPTKPGLYLFAGCFGGAPELITVYLRHCESYGGLPADKPYLAAAGHSTAPERWLGQWSAPIEVISSLDSAAKQA